MRFNKKPVHILLAPNAFKNSLPANEVAAALAEGLQQSACNAISFCCGVGDGGDGTAALLAQHLKGKKQLYQTVNPLGKTITAPVYYTKNGTAIIELADASGLRLLNPYTYAPLQATTLGTGILIKKALNRKANRILLAIGGSATIDGGTGILSALGVRFLNADGKLLNTLPEIFSELKYIDTSALDTRFLKTECVVLCDVNNKLLGAKGAARIFGPQKGATEKDIIFLEKGLKRLNQTVLQTCGINMNQLPHSGAAGGVAALLTALCNAHAVNGCNFFLDAIGFEKLLKKSDLVITGEGSIDAQTLQGKAPFCVAQQAKNAGIPVIGVAGMVEPKNKNLLHYFNELITINKTQTTLATALKNTRKNLIATGKEIGTRIATGQL